MESKNNIDKLFKDKLVNREFDIKESFLADLEEKLDAQKPAKKDRGWFFYILIALVGVSLFAYYVITGNVNEAIDYQISMEGSTQYVVSNKVEHKEIEGDLETKTTQGDQLKVDTYSSTDKSTDRIKKEIQQEENQELPDNISNDENSIKKTNALNNKEESSTSRNRESKAYSDNISEKNIAVGSDIQIEGKEEIGNSLKPSEKVHTPKQEVKEMNSNTAEFVKEHLSGNTSLIDDKDFSLPEMNAGDTENDTAMLTNENPNLELVLENDAVTNEEIIDTTILASDSIVAASLALEKEISEEFSDTLSKDDSIVNEAVIIPEDANETFKKWTLSVFGGPSLINKKIAGGSADAYLAKRNDEEANIVSMSYGLRMNYNFNEKINFSLGVNSLTYGEDINYSTIYDTQTSISTVAKDSSYLDYVYTPFQDTINGYWDTLITSITIDTTFMVDTTIIDINSTDYAGKNRFTYLQIPIMFGYKFTFNKLSVNVRLGGSYGVLLKNSGSYVDYSVSNIELPNLRKTIINMVASATIGYQFKKFNLFLEPKYRLNTNNIINDTGINQKYTAFGCNFGLSFGF